MHWGCLLAPLAMHIIEMLASGHELFLAMLLENSLSLLLRWALQRLDQPTRLLLF